MVKTLSFQCWGAMGLIFLVGELGSYMTHGIAKEKEVKDIKTHLYSQKPGAEYKRRLIGY